MLTLGLNGNFGTAEQDLTPGMPDYYYHDAAACLVRDGELIAAVEEERFNRIKKTTKFPVNAIRACLAKAGVTPADVDAVGFYFAQEFNDFVLNSWYLEHPRLEPRYCSDLIRALLRGELDWDLPADRLVFTPHHVSHALSSFARSGMADALVVVLDARGESESGTIFRAVDGKLDALGTYPVESSLGTFYENAIQLIGYRFGDEYKAMGLAPYGDPAAYAEIFEGLYELRDDGDYVLNPGSPEVGLVGPAFFAHGFEPRRKGEPFTRQHKDFAAGLQHTLEKIAMHVLGHWSRQTGLRNLCFTGGVAHNSTLNGLILKSGLFDAVFVHPSSHDAGAAEGAAISAAHQLGDVPRTATRLRSASLGPDLGTPETVARTLASWRDLVDFEAVDDIVDTSARLLADGHVLGWATGPSEFGPRALGNRSIVADARPAHNQSRINEMVKKRESFRPFAPVTTPQAARRYFELPETEANYDFMSYVVDVREDARAGLGAITHINGTARLQIVDEDANARFHRLVTRFGELTGTPVLLNTSFNNNAEPIVQSTEDALACFLTTGLDFLVVEDFLVRRRPGHDRAYDHFAVRFRPVTKLARIVRQNRAGEREVRHEIYLDYTTGPRATVSAELFELLEAADGGTTLAALAQRTGRPLTDEVRQELHDVWQARFVVLEPLSGRA